jgi:hypothetical protein
MDFAQLVNLATIIEDALGDRRFASINMRDYADIADLIEGWLTHRGFRFEEWLSP